MIEKDKYTATRRVWFKPPYMKWSGKSQWVGRPVENFNVTPRKMLEVPKEFVGNGHYEWQLYHHDDTVQDLVGILRRWLEALDAGGAPVPVSEILEAIQRYER